MLYAKPQLLGNQKKNEFKTRGLDSDQTVSAIKATEKMLNII
jgi:D-citramalate synthase